MVVTKMIFLCAMVLVLSNVAIAATSEAELDANSGLALSRVQLFELSNAALTGSPEAAEKVALHYGFVVMDQKEARNWLRIAAENGHIVSQYNLGYDLRMEGDPISRIRARFWLRLAASKGHEKAKKLLKSLESERMPVYVPPK